MTTRHTAPDLLRWQLSPILAVVLDDIENVDVIVLGHRAPVPNMKDFAEAIRQAHAQQHGTAQPDAQAALAAEIATHAAAARNDLVRQHIADAAASEFDRNPSATGTAALSRGIADRAMEGMAPLFTEAVISYADAVLRQLADSRDWQENPGIRAMTEVGTQVLADASKAGARLLEFTRDVAQMRMTSETDDDGDLFDGSDGPALDLLQGIIGRARELLGIPGPDQADATGPDDGEEEAKFRWNYHSADNGQWCPFSHVVAPARLADSDDQRCPHGCDLSEVEPIVPTPPAGPAVSPNGLLPENGQ
jgi:hypothetical protein